MIMVISSMFAGFSHILKEVALALSSLAVIICFFQFAVLKLPISEFLNIVKGFFLTFLGIALFLQGVYIGFIPIGQKMGLALGSLDYNWILIPIGLVLGFVAILAEPAVHVLNQQVEKVSGGYIPRKVMLYCLCIGVAFSVALAMARILYGINLAYILIPGYLLAFFMMRYTSETFVSIAFDSGGVATGPMTVSFILAMAIGVATTIEGRDPIVEGFGMIALVALAPVLSVLALGFIYSRLEKRSNDENL